MSARSADPNSRATDTTSGALRFPQHSENKRPLPDGRTAEADEPVRRLERCDGRLVLDFGAVCVIGDLVCAAFSVLDR